MGGGEIRQFFRSYTGYLETELAQFTEIHLLSFGKGFQQIVYSSGENGHHIGATHGSLWRNTFAELFQGKFAIDLWGGVSFGSRILIQRIGT